MAGGHKREYRRNSRTGIFQFYRHSAPQSSPRNLMLAVLPPEEHNLLRRYLELVPLKSGEVLWEPNQALNSVYFLDNGMVSFVVVMRDGASAEVGTTGREGFVGIPVVLGAARAPVRAIVQIAGDAYRIESDLLLQLLPQTPQLEQMLHRYAYAYSMQVAQVAACNCLHKVPQRLARWLAMSYDRVGSARLPLTQELLSQMLGCRRSSITSAAGGLQKAGVLGPGHGQVRILAPRQLEKRACECYAVMKQLSDLT
jgi:CRP-like cAMP-binding protein